MLAQLAGDLEHPAVERTLNADTGGNVDQDLHASKAPEFGFHRRRSVFIGCGVRLSADEARELLEQVVESEEIPDALEVLLWFGFLGVAEGHSGDPRYAFEWRHDVKKLLVPIQRNSGHFVVHPAFRASLGCVE
jgi:hypothetical protein